MCLSAHSYRHMRQALNAQIERFSRAPNRALACVRNGKVRKTATLAVRTPHRGAKRAHPLTPAGLYSWASVTCSRTNVTLLSLARVIPRIGIGQVSGRAEVVVHVCMASCRVLCACAVCLESVQYDRVCNGGRRIVPVVSESSV